MKPISVAALAAPLLAAVWMSTSWAQATSDGPKTRAQVIAERDEFFRTHQWDTCLESWVLKQEFKKPEVSCSRDEVRKERDEFLKSHRWDPVNQGWVPLTPQTRELGTLTRDQVRRETLEFLRTHEWDDINSTWRERAAVVKPRS